MTVDLSRYWEASYPPSVLGVPTPRGDGEFDPADHTVDEVKAYVGKHPDDAGAVLESELAGKNRSTLVTWLQPEPEATGDE